MNTPRKSWISINEFCKLNPAFKPDRMRLLVQQHRAKLIEAGCLVKVGRSQYLDEDLFSEMLGANAFAGPGRG